VEVDDLVVDLARLDDPVVERADGLARGHGG
jgi:hypothetical protein